MKKPKTIKEFFFKEANINDKLNTTLPINIKHLESLIERVHKRYPLIEKSEVAIIVKMTFESFRELLVSGCILNFNKFVFNMKLYFFKATNKPAVKMKLTTPPPIRTHNDQRSEI